MAQFFSQLRQAPQCRLTRLVLHHNELFDSDIERLCEALVSHGGVRELNVAFNCLGNRGVLALAQASQLHTLDVSCNNDVTSSEALARVVVANRRLTALRASHLDVADQSALVAAVARSTTILNVNLGWKCAEQALIDQHLARNAAIQWRVVKPLLLDVCVAMAPLLLPAYVMLEIFDRLPLMDLVNQKLKIDVIIRVFRFRQLALDRRSARVNE
jgi:hypothetical protein